MCHAATTAASCPPSSSLRTSRRFLVRACRPERASVRLTPPADEHARLPCRCAAPSGIVKSSIALPDVHSGYGFAIGNVAAFDMSNPESIVSPGAPEAWRAAVADTHAWQPVETNVGAAVAAAQAAWGLISTAACAFCARTSSSQTSRRRGTCQWLRHAREAARGAHRCSLPLCALQVKEKLAQSLFDHIPVGVGSLGIIRTSAAALEAALDMGMDWCVSREARGPRCAS